MTVNKHSYGGKHRARQGMSIKKALGLAKKFAHKRGSGRSVTSTKKEEKMHGDDVHSGITSTGYRVVVNPKMPKSVLNRVGWQYLENYTGQLSSNPGAQGCSTIAQIGTVAQCMVSSGNTVNYGSASSLGFQSYMSINPNEASTGGPVIAAIAQPASDRFLLDRTTLTIRLANFSNMASEAELYVFKSKMNSAHPPDTLWTELSVDSVNNQYAAATQPVSGSATGNALGRASTTFVGATPFQHPTFKKFFQLLKVHHVNLAAAAEEKVVFNIKNNQLIDTTKIIELNTSYTTSPASWTQAATDIFNLRGTVCVMLVVRGALARDTGIANVCTLASTETGFSVSKHHYFKPVKSIQARFNPVVGMTQFPSTTDATTKTFNVVDALQNISRI